MGFTKAVRTAGRARVGLIGPSGSGKTFTALRLAKGLAGGGKVAVLDTERGSASKYAGRFEFDVDDELPDFSPQTLMNRIREAEKAGYAVVVVDSLSHFWMGTGGELEMVDAAKKRSAKKDGFSAWREVTPLHNQLIDTLLTVRMHVICTMRVKTEYVVEKDENGKSAPRKVGLAPVQRDGMEYEFDLVGDLDDAQRVVTKTRLSEVVPRGSVIREPGEELGAKLAAWLSDAPVKPSPPDLTHWKAALALVTEQGWSPDDLKAHLKKAHGVESAAKVTAEHVAAIRRHVEPPAPDDGIAPHVYVDAG